MSVHLGNLFPLLPQASFEDLMVMLLIIGLLVAPFVIHDQLDVGSGDSWPGSSGRRGIQRNDDVVDPIVIRTAEIAVITLQLLVGHVVTAERLACQNVMLTVAADDAMSCCGLSVCGLRIFPVPQTSPGAVGPGRARLPPVLVRCSSSSHRCRAEILNLVCQQHAHQLLAAFPELLTHDAPGRRMPAWHIVRCCLVSGLLGGMMLLFLLELLPALLLRFLGRTSTSRSVRLISRCPCAFRCACQRDGSAVARWPGARWCWQPWLFSPSSLCC